jgi:hypothetical protein
MEDFENLSNWDKFVNLNDCYMTSMDCCMEEEAEDYWEKLEDVIAKMPEYQQIEAKEYQWNMAEKIAEEEEMAKTIGN